MSDGRHRRQEAGFGFPAGTVKWTKDGEPWIAAEVNDHGVFEMSVEAADELFGMLGYKRMTE